MFAAVFIFAVVPECLFAETTDNDAIEKVKVQAEAKEIKRQAAEETKKIKEEVKDMKKKGCCRRGYS
jgi:ABC-type Zn2+ transport system substrate-binding protein/surface adhesin